MTNGYRNSEQDGMPADIVQAWKAAGATYGRMRLDDSDCLGWKLVVDPTIESGGLPGFLFSRWKPGVMDSLPIPPTPFGLRLQGLDPEYDEEYVGTGEELRYGSGAMSHLWRFASTLVELELNDITEKDLSDLHQLTHLRSLGFCDTGLVDRSAIERLIQIPSLETVRLNQKELGAVEAGLLAQLPSLRNLFLAVNKATEEGVEILVSAKQLVEIHLNVSKECSPAGGQRLSQLRSLRSLIARNCHLTDETIAGLSTLPKLEKLDTKVTDVGLKALANSKSLVDLDVGLSAITDTGAKSIAMLSTLQSLVVTDSEIGDAGIAAICKLPRLQSLGLAGTKIMDAGMKHLASLKGLKSLYLTFVDATEAAYKSLEQLTELEDLSLYGTKVTDNGLKVLRNLKKLRSVDLRGNKITDAGIAHLKGLPALREVEVDHTVMTNTGLRHYLAALPSTKKLSLQDTQITDEGLEILRHYPEIVSVNVASTSISSAGVKHLIHLPNLRGLGLCYTHVSDEAIDYILTLKKLEWLDLCNLHPDGGLMTFNSLKRLAALPSLSDLMICAWEHVSRPQIDELRGLMPHCSIITG